MSTESDIRVHIIIEREDSHSWNAFVESNPCSTPYHLWEFGQALSSTYGYERYYLLARNDDEVVGVFPLIHIRSRLFGNRLLSLPFCEYGGPLVSSNFGDLAQTAEGLFEEVLTIASSLNIDCIEIRNPSLHGELLENEGCHVVRRYVTFEIDLSREKEHLWRSLDKKTRNSTRKAMKSELNVYEVSQEDDLKEYFLLYLKTQNRHGSPPHDFKLFRNLFRLNAENSMKILIAEYCAKPIAGAIVFHNKRNIYWWGGVSDPKFRHLNATDILLWKIIEWGHESGFAGLNLGRTRYGTGIYHFKKGWGGIEIPLVDFVYHAESKDASTPDPSEGKYQFLTKLWSRLPVCISRRLGPRIIKQVGL